MKAFGFLSFGHYAFGGQRGPSAEEIAKIHLELAQAADEIGVNNASFRVHHFVPQASAPMPLLGAVAGTTKNIEVGTGVIDMRYENPFYMAEDAGAADLISRGRLQLGLSRGSPEQVIEGWRHFGYAPEPGETDADMARRRTETFLKLMEGEGFAAPSPHPMFPNPPGLLRLEPFSAGLRDRIWWGAASDATAVWAAQLGMHLQSSTLKTDESGEPLHIQQARQIRLFRQAWKAAGHEGQPRASVSRSIFALVNDRDRQLLGGQRSDRDQIGIIDNTRTVFGRSYAAEPEELVRQLERDEAIREADTLLLTIPNQLGVDYNIHALEAILTQVAPALGWR